MCRCLTSSLVQVDRLWLTACWLRSLLQRNTVDAEAPLVIKHQMKHCNGKPIVLLVGLNSDFASYMTVSGSTCWRV